MQHIPDDLYRQIHASMPIPCADAVICHDKRVLLCKRTNNPAKGLYWFPGGRVLKDETLREAVMRKVREETGLEVTIEENLGVDETIFPDGPFGGPTHTINVVFAVTPTSTAIPASIDTQHSEMRWFDETELNSLHPYIQTYAQRALKLV